MAHQLPRCVRQASWMLVWGKVGGGGCISVRGGSTHTVAEAMSVRVLASPSRSQSLLILCRSSSSSSLKSVCSSGERLRIASPGIGRNFAVGFVLSCGRGLRANRLPLLSSFLTWGFISGEASALNVGSLKESLVKDGEKEGENESETGEEQARASLDILPAVEKETDGVRERDTLVAQTKSKELELAAPRTTALRLVEEKQGVEANASDSASRAARGFPEIDDSAQQPAASQVATNPQESAHDFVTAPYGTDSALAEELVSDRSEEIDNVNVQGEGSSVAVGRGDEAGSESVAHPWPVAQPSRGISRSAQESVKQQKKSIRAAVKRRLRNLPLHLREEEDHAIQDHVLSANWFKQSNSVCAYLSCAALREVDTAQIVEQLLQQSNADKAKELYVPRIVDREANMSMLEISSSSDLIVNEWGIVEPDFNYPDGNPRKNVMDAETPIDLVLMPGLAFDRAGQRLGRGGGYYDVFLQKYLLLAASKGWKRPLLVALAYSVQVLEDPVPVDGTDVPVDALVLSTGVLPISEYGTKNLSNLSTHVSASTLPLGVGS